jgi:hypothetical protein
MIKFKKTHIYITATTLLLSVIFTTLIIQRKMTIPFFYKFEEKEYFTIGTINTKNPLAINKDSILHFDPRNLNLIPNVKLMADPFIVQNNNEYFIFYEQFSGKTNATFGDLAVLKSTDLKQWTYQGLVLDEPFHLSFPNVFKWNNKWYMLPEAGASNSLRLYSTDNFPFDWKLQSILIKNKVFADPILIAKNDKFYILVQDNSDFSLRLYISDSLESNWKEHPSSPIRIGQNNRVRPAGRQEILHDSLYYFVQDHSHGYGTAVITYIIDSLTPTTFKDHKVKSNPVLSKFGTGWAANGMHQLSWIKTSDSNYFCVVDGRHTEKKEFGWDWRNIPDFRW